MHCVLAGVGAETGAYNGFVKLKMQRIYFAEEVDFLQKSVIILLVLSTNTSMGNQHGVRFPAAWNAPASGTVG